MEGDLITVVLPIYGVENYMDRCIESVIHQTYENLEIILVDDGSPDSCPEKCDRWAETDHRIKVVHKQNAGLGMARNTGIENATGKYIVFFDSDDYVAPDLIAKCYRKAVETAAQIVMYGLYVVSSDGNVIGRVIPRAKKELYAGQEVVHDILAEMIAHDPQEHSINDLVMSAWGSMYSMDLIQERNWRFVSEREYISEDFYSLLVLYRYVDRVAILSEGFYFYCHRDSSLSREYRADRLERLKVLYAASQELCQELGYGERISERLKRQFLSNLIGAFKTIESADMTEHEKYEQVAGAVQDKALRQIVRSISLSQETASRKVFAYALRAKQARLIRLLIRLKTGRTH